MSAPAPEAPPPPCPWCGATPAPAGHRLMACPACGAAVTWPAPDEPELAEAYGGPYRPAAGRFGPLTQALLTRGRGALATRLDAIAPPGPVLDVGAGDGVLLDALARAGRLAVGLERGGVPARPDIVAADLVDFSERAGEWAAVVLWHSLEHLRDPVAALTRAGELLAPGGVLVLAVPNRDSLQARCFGDAWLALDLPRHLHHLTGRALAGWLTDRGWRIERVSAWRGGQGLFGWLHGLVGAAGGGVALYDAIRSPGARFRPMSPAVRAATLWAALQLAPLAGVGYGLELLTGRGGSFYLEARAPVQHNRRHA